MNVSKTIWFAKTELFDSPMVQSEQIMRTE